VNQCAAIILAAGSSRRLGSPKQLLPYKTQSLLKHAVSVALESNAEPVLTVLGSNSETLVAELATKRLEIVFNEKWKEGIASSIRCGLDRLQEKFPAIDAAILMVCDQPFISTALLNELITVQQQTAKPIVSSLYGGVAGTPALFHKSLFPLLLGLTGDTGAGKIVRQRMDSAATVLFPNGEIDIDTADDYQALLNSRI
jgi:molybdenum cofactor cytidylyltransferase